MRVTDDKLIVRNLTKKTAGGIVMSGMVIAYTMYEIVACGPGHYHRQSGTVFPMEVKPGDRVLINYGSCTPLGEKIKLPDGTEDDLFLVPTAEEVVMVLDDDETIGL